MKNAQPLTSSKQPRFVPATNRASLSPVDPPVAEPSSTSSEMSSKAKDFAKPRPEQLPDRLYLSQAEPVRSSEEMLEFFAAQSGDHPRVSGLDEVAQAVGVEV